MNVLQVDGTYSVASPEIVLLTGGGAQAQRTRHSVTFLPNIADTNASVTLVTPDQKTLRSRPLCLSYYDASSGNSVLIAEITNSIGELAPGDSKILYPHCFSDFKCDLLYLNAIGRFEQDLVIEEQPPRPSDYGLNDDSTKLQLLTEFFNPPVPGRQMSVKGDSDVVLDFGEMKMGKGKAFIVGNAFASGSPVEKHWQVLEGRQFLIEEVDYRAIKSRLDQLPLHVASNNDAKKKYIASKVRRLPKVVASNGRRKERLKTAEFESKPRGFVIDYTIVSGLSDYVFAGNTTYYVTNFVDLFGTPTLEGGAVIKFATNSALDFYSTLNCLTGPYRPGRRRCLIYVSRGGSSCGVARCCRRFDWFRGEGACKNWSPMRKSTKKIS